MMASFFHRDETNTWRERLKIIVSLLRCGWIVNPINGRIIFSFFTLNCKCNSLKLLRHGKTVAVERNEFMSNNSANCSLTVEGINEIKKVADELLKKTPDVILLGPLQRTEDTFSILQDQSPDSLPVIRCPNMLGINNSIWAEKSLEMLDAENLFVFLQRECSHNIFAKAKYGDSWGDVLVRCAKLIHVINREYKGKDVLLISQGSIYQGFKILLHHSKNPWDGYSADAMFCAKPSHEQSIGYGKIFQIW